MTETAFRAFAVNHEERTAGVRTFTDDELGTGDVTIDVMWSGLNYKDALASRADGRVARLAPLIPGIDLAGTVVATCGDGPSLGSEVVVQGYDLGVAHHGGFSERARVPAEWIVPLEGLSTREAMTIGTAGYTAALCVDALERNGLTPEEDGEVLVLGASGGVGSVAVSLLAKRGHRPVAVTGTPDAADWLRERGAVEVIDRDAALRDAKPLGKERWAGCVDPVGGPPLAYALSTMQYGSTVASCGNVAGAALETTVFPFILRAISLVGIDSVSTPIERRRQIWRGLTDDLPSESLAALGTKVITLDEIPAALSDVHQGVTVGRTLLALR
jgi:acrylyl-CoA reductase (NADPH)